MEATSVTSIEEKALANWLFTCPTVPPSIHQYLGFNANSKLRLAVPTDALFQEKQLPGDIDILVHNSPKLGVSTAIELKRVKIQTQAFVTGSPNKIEDLKKGVHQANALHDLGFARAFLLVAIVTDGRERHDANFAFRGPLPDHLKAIRNFQGRELLHDDVGLGYVEITQPVDKPIEMAGGIGVYFDKEPIVCKQSITVTDAVEQYFKMTMYQYKT